jgi:hypothetical protein
VLALDELAGPAGTHAAAHAKAEAAAGKYRPGSAAADHERLLAEALSLITLLRTHAPDRDLWTLAYTESGEWARHFSTVRATVTTFLVGVSVGVLSFGWDKPAWRIFAAIAAGVWVLMLFLLWLFTWDLKIRWRQQQQNEDRVGLRALLASEPGRSYKAPKPGAARWWTGLWDAPFGVMLLLTIGLAVALCYHESPDPGPARVEVTTLPELVIQPASEPPRGPMGGDADAPGSAPPAGDGG